VDEEAPQDRQLNIFFDPQTVAGTYANSANISVSHYEFTIDFMRIDHESEGPEVQGALVARVNLSHRFMRELIDALQDSWSKWETREGIRNLPETPGD
jgi:hypothetical protein